jgi:hypothetical protein
MTESNAVSFGCTSLVSPVESTIITENLIITSLHDLRVLRYVAAGSGASGGQKNRPEIALRTVNHENTASRTVFLLTRNKGMGRISRGAGQGARGQRENHQASGGPRDFFYSSG